jgi:hypothetical protein
MCPTKNKQFNYLKNMQIHRQKIITIVGRKSETLEESTFFCCIVSVKGRCFLCVVISSVVSVSFLLLLLSSYVLYCSLFVSS